MSKLEAGFQKNAFLAGLALDSQLLSGDENIVPALLGMLEPCSGNIRGITPGTLIYVWSLPEALMLAVTGTKP